MLLLLELHFRLLAAHRAVLRHSLNVLLPTDSHFVLLVKTHGSQPVSRLGAEHGEDSALTARHGRRVKDETCSVQAKG